MALIFIVWESMDDAEPAVHWRFEQNKVRNPMDQFLSIPAHWHLPKHRVTLTHLPYNRQWQRLCLYSLTNCKPSIFSICFLVPFKIQPLGFSRRFSLQKFLNRSNEWLDVAKLTVSTKLKAIIHMDCQESSNINACEHPQFQSSFLVNLVKKIQSLSINWILNESSGKKPVWINEHVMSWNLKQMNIQ